MINPKRDPFALNSILCSKVNPDTRPLIKGKDIAN